MRSGEEVGSKKCLKKGAHKWVVPRRGYNDLDTEVPAGMRVCARKGCGATKMMVPPADRGDEIPTGWVSGYFRGDGLPGGEREASEDDRILTGREMNAAWGEALPYEVVNELREQ